MLPAILLGLTVSPQQVVPVKPELVASVSAAKAGEPFIAAVILRMEPGWHVFWRNPGDAGTPTGVEWKLPPGWTASELRWPVPQRFSEKEGVGFGYEGSTLLLATITPGDTPKAGPANIAAKVSWTASKDTLVPGTKDLRLGLTMMPVKSGPSRTWFDRLALADKAMPPAADGWTIESGAVAGGFVLKAKPPEAVEFGRGLPTFIPSDAGVLDHSEPHRFLMREDGAFWLALKSSKLLAKTPDRLRGLLIAPRGVKWKGDVEAIAVDVPITPAP
jgi:hypothetical protein